MNTWCRWLCCLCALESLVLVGPLEVPSLGSNLYLATYLDDYSKLLIVKPVKEKADVPEVTKEVVSFME